MAIQKRKNAGNFQIDFQREKKVILLFELRYYIKIYYTSLINIANYIQNELLYLLVVKLTKIKIKSTKKNNFIQSLFINIFKEISKYLKFNQKNKKEGFFYGNFKLK